MPVTIELRQRHDLWFAPGDPVRAASAVVGWREGWLVAQDDAVHLAWWSPERGRATRVRVFPSTGGRDVFEEASGTKHLKPDLEAGCDVRVDGSRAALFLGSGSLPQRTRAGVDAVRTYVLANMGGLPLAITDVRGLGAIILPSVSAGARRTPRSPP